jgi:hypothetical protein
MRDPRRRNYIDKNRWRVLLPKCGFHEIDLRELDEAAILRRAKEALTVREYPVFSRELEARRLVRAKGEEPRPFRMGSFPPKVRSIFSILFTCRPNNPNYVSERGVERIDFNFAVREFDKPQFGI